MRSIFLVILVLLVMTISTFNQVDACSGNFPKTIREAANRADTIIFGKVIAISDKKKDTQHTFEYYDAKVLVSRYWKGNGKKESIIQFDTSTCGAFLEKGQQGIIYASGSPLFTSALNVNIIDSDPAKNTPADTDYQRGLKEFYKEMGKGMLPK